MCATTSSVLCATHRSKSCAPHSPKHHVTYVHVQVYYEVYYAVTTFTTFPPSPSEADDWTEVTLTMLPGRPS